MTATGTVFYSLICQRIWFICLNNWNNGISKIDRNIKEIMLFFQSDRCLFWGFFWGGVIKILLSSSKPQLFDPLIKPLNYCTAHHDLLSWKLAIGSYWRITRGLCGSSHVYSVLFRFLCSAPIGRRHLAGGRSCIFCSVATCQGESQLGLGWRQAATWGLRRWSRPISGTHKCFCVVIGSTKPEPAGRRADAGGRYTCWFRYTDTFTVWNCLCSLGRTEARKSIP